MSLWQGIKGAQVELAAIPDPVRKLQRIASISKIFASEILGTIALAPFAARASALYRSLPPLVKYDPSGGHPVYLVKDARYDTTAPRNTIDLYVPAEAAAARQATQQGQHRAYVPVVVFVHGGVWAAGDKWHYAPVANCLARLGVLACVVSYTLYPDALVPQIVQEVSAAFDWAMKNVEQYGGDKQQVSLVGHSAGAQLCMMALLQQAKTVHETLRSSQQTPVTVIPNHQDDLPAMPKQFVAITGVYDIAKHYAYEKQRGVHELSTMKRAMGGLEGFAAMSPAVILGAALQTQYVGNKRQPHRHQQEAGCHSSCALQQQQQQELPAVDFSNSFQLSGESIAHRIGFDRGSAHHVAAEAAVQLQSEAGMSDIMQFPLDAAAYLPPTVLMSSCTDVTVPWYESAEMYYKLLDAGVPVKHLVYNKVGHGDFVVDWPTVFTTIASNTDDWGSPASTPSTAAASGQCNHVQHAAEGSSVAANCGADSNNGMTDPTDTDNHCNNSSGGWGTGFAAAGISSQTKQAGQLAPLQAHQQRQLLLQDLPPYCRDLAIVVMGQQLIQFVHRQRHQMTDSAVERGLGVGGSEVSAGDSDVLASVITGAAGGSSSPSSTRTGVLPEQAADAQMLVDASELN